MKLNKYYTFPLILIIHIILTGCASNNGLEINSRNNSNLNNSNNLLFVKDYHLMNLPSLENITLEEFDKKVHQLISKANKDQREYLASELFLKANDSSYRGEAQISAMYFKHLISLSDKKLFKKKYVIELIRSGKINESEKLLEDLVLKDFKDEALALVLGGVYTAQSKNNKALTIYREIWRKFKSPEACVYWAKNLVRQNKGSSAIKTINQCSKEKKSPVFNYFIGQYFLKKDNYKTATKYFKNALKIDGHYDKAAISIGLIMESKEKYKKAIKFYRNYLKKNPDSYSINSRVVQLMFSQNFGKAIIPYAENMINLDPNDLNTKVKLGILYTDSNEFKKAKGLFREILAAAPASDKVLYYLGALNQQTQNYNQAIVYFSKIESESGLFLDGNIQISNILKIIAENSNGKPDSEIIQRKFVNFTKDRISKYAKIRLNLSINLANYFENINKVKESIHILEFVKNDPDFKDDQSFYLASLYDKLNDYKNSEKIIKSMLEKNPKNADALNFLGYSYLERGYRLDKALSYLTKANSLKPNNGYILDSLGWYHFKTGNFKKAFHLIKKAWKFANKDMTIAKHLALVYEKFEDYHLAKKYYLEALKQCTNLKDKKSILKNISDLETLRIPASSLSR